MDNRKSPILLPTARGLNRVEAARYVGVSPAFFDSLVEEGKMPKPVRLGTRTIYDVRALDGAFDALDAGPVETASKAWDSVL